MQSKKRKLEHLGREQHVLRAAIAALSNKLDAVTGAWVQLHHDVYGAFSLFSLLPLELIFVILEHVVRQELAQRCRVSGAFNFFLTCRAASDLRSEWAHHLYMQLGGLCPHLTPPCVLLHTMLTKLAVKQPDQKTCMKFLRLGMDARVARRRNYISLREDEVVLSWRGFRFGVHPRFWTAAVTRAVLSYPGLTPLVLVVENSKEAGKMIDTIPLDEFLGCVAKQPFWQDDWLMSYFGRYNFDALVSLVDAAPKWVGVLKCVMKPSNHSDFSWEQIGKLLAMCQPDWITCWCDISSERGWHRRFIKAVVRDAPQWLLRLPFGKDAADSPLFFPENEAATLMIDYRGAVKAGKVGTSRLSGLAPQAYSVKVKRKPWGWGDEAQSFGIHMRAVGVGVRWR